MGDPLGEAMLARQPTPRDLNLIRQAGGDAVLAKLAVLPTHTHASHQPALPADTFDVVCDTVANNPRKLEVAEWLVLRSFVTSEQDLWAVRDCWFHNKAICDGNVQSSRSVELGVPHLGAGAAGIDDDDYSIWWYLTTHHHSSIRILDSMGGQFVTGHIDELADRAGMGGTTYTQYAQLLDVAYEGGIGTGCASVSIVWCGTQRALVEAGQRVNIGRVPGANLLLAHAAVRAQADHFDIEDQMQAIWDDVALIEGADPHAVTLAGDLAVSATDDPVTELLAVWGLAG